MAAGARLLRPKLAASMGQWRLDWEAARKQAAFVAAGFLFAPSSFLFDVPFVFLENHPFSNDPGRSHDVSRRVVLSQPGAARAGDNVVGFCFVCVRGRLGGVSGCG